jgi:hypothetical protein
LHYKTPHKFLGYIGHRCRRPFENPQNAENSMAHYPQRQSRSKVKEAYVAFLQQVKKIGAINKTAMNP